MTAKRINRGGGHSYEVDGEKVPGVTTIIGDGLPKPALMAWGPNTVAQYVADRVKLVKLELAGGTQVEHVIADDLVEGLAELAARNKKKWPKRFSTTAIYERLRRVHYDDRDAAGVKGTKVHKFAEDLAAGKDVTVPPELEGHVDAYLAFRDDFDPVDELSEVIVVNRRYGYMGTTDLIATIRLPREWVEENLPELDLEEDGRLNEDGTVNVRALIDYKTSRSGPYGETALQLAGYRHAETMLDDTGVEVDMPQVDACFVLWVRADGYDLVPFTAGELEFRCFLWVRQVAWFQNEHSRTLKGETVQPVAQREDIEEDA